MFKAEKKNRGTPTMAAWVRRRQTESKRRTGWQLRGSTGSLTAASPSPWQRTSHQSLTDGAVHFSQWPLSPGDNKERQTGGHMDRDVDSKDRDRGTLLDSDSAWKASFEYRTTPPPRPGPSSDLRPSLSEHEGVSVRVSSGHTQSLTWTGRVRSGTHRWFRETHLISMSTCRPTATHARASMFTAAIRITHTAITAAR